MTPAKKSAVLRFINSYAYATLAPHTATKAEQLNGQQEIYFVQSGKGTAHAGSQSVDLYRNIAVLVPAGLNFSIENTGDQPMTMYVINEPTPPGFRPNTKHAGPGRESVAHLFQQRHVGPYREDSVS